VQAIFDDADGEAWVCAISIAEFARRLRALGASATDARERALAYLDLMDHVVAVDSAVAVRAFELAAVTDARVPLVDTLIAAAAQSVSGTLVHRDQHFSALASVEQMMIGQE
jgi:predicted nucleic acid-binding protein